jgi:hypothetical protein
MAIPAEYTQNYPIFGRELQLRPVYVDGYGLKRRPMHSISKARSPAGWGEWGKKGRRHAPRISSKGFVKNLRRSRVDFVLSSKWDTQAWPPQQKLLKKSQRAIEIYSDNYSSIWRIKPAHASRHD